MRAIRRKVEIVIIAIVASAAFGGCSTANDAAQPALHVPDGVACGSDTCAQGAVCCIAEGGASCRPGAGGAGFYSVSADAAAQPALCGTQPFLACDDPQDCPTGTVCCLESVLTVPHAACVSPALSGAGCGRAAQVCQKDSDCPGTHCKPDHEGLPTDGYVSVCQ